ncbi:MAG: hypothetical protein Q4A41_02470 [Bacillota bacterium]|nr:hypothetical protein [Bacillota bacterium]
MFDLFKPKKEKIRETRDKKGEKSKKKKWYDVEEFELFDEIFEEDE